MQGQQEGDAAVELTQSERMLADAVRKWAAGTVPGEPDAWEAAVAAALDVFHSGGSAGESCDAARRLIGCWMHHPSRGGAAPARLATAS